MNKHKAHAMLMDALREGQRVTVAKSGRADFGRTGTFIEFLPGCFRAEERECLIHLDGEGFDSEICIPVACLLPDSLSENFEFRQEMGWD